MHACAPVPDAGCVWVKVDGPSSPMRGEQGTIMGFLRSREGALGMLSMALLIFQGTALSLTLRFSRCARPTFQILAAWSHPCFASSFVWKQCRRF